MRAAEGTSATKTEPVNAVSRSSASNPAQTLPVQKRDRERPTPACCSHTPDRRRRSLRTRPQPWNTRRSGSVPISQPASNAQNTPTETAANTFILDRSVWLRRCAVAGFAASAPSRRDPSSLDERTQPHASRQPTVDPLLETGRQRARPLERPSETVP